MIRIFLLIFLVSGYVCAQENPREAYKALTPEQQRAFFEQSKSYRFTAEDMNASAVRLGVEQNSRHIQRMIGATPKNPWREKIETLQVVKHLQGQSGINYPDPEAVKASYPALEVNEDSIRKMVREQYMPQVNRQINAMTKLPPLPKCSKSGTTKKQISETRNQSANRPETDILFLQQELDPDDAKEVIGTETKIMLYSSGKDVEVQRAARGMGVECLPTRFRVTGQYFFIDQGINALRNYDEDYHARGQLHPFYKKVDF